MTTSASTWGQADKAYQAHHFACPQCIAAGARPGAGAREPRRISRQLVLHERNETENNNMTAKTETFLREKQVLATVAPVHRTTWWRWVKQGIAPKPVAIGPRAKAWRMSDLERWQRGEWGVRAPADLPSPA
ncbi:MAG: AlpA family phage regulatory protein [Acidovorax sp.]|jgi:predicted DNA-binding transcriptional regulator AlpA|nr:AlpA family phage regulatory protein [Acidovorax sp.]